MCRSSNPYDGHTLAATLEATQSVTGIEVTDAYVDKSYRGHGYTGSTCVHIAGSKLKTTSRSERKRRRRRSAIEPKIGHLKSDHRMNRCFLAELQGDVTNAVLAAAGSNIHKLLRRFVFALVRWLECAFVLPITHRIPVQRAA